MSELTHYDLLIDHIPLTEAAQSDIRRALIDIFEWRHGILRDTSLSTKED
jgi:hypothetical protein